MTLKVLALAALVTPFLLSTCVHGPVLPIVVPVIVEWTIPIGLADDARVCVQTALGAGINPGDVLPLRCVSAGAMRQWIRAQRWAN